MKKSIKLTNKETNTWLALLGNITLVMVLFSICRILFYLFNLDIYPDITFRQFLRMMAGGLRFDLAAVLMVNSVYLVAVLLSFRYRSRPTLQKIIKYWFVFSNGIALMMNCIDMGYFQFTMRRTNSSIFREFKGEGSLAGLILDMIADFWYIALIWIVFLFLLAVLYLKIKPDARPTGKSGWIKYGAINFAGIAVVVLIWFVGIRGDFRNHSRPLTSSDAGNYVERTLEVAIVQNTPFTIIKTIGRTTPRRVVYFDSEKELEKIYSPVHYPQDKEEFSPRNVVIIIWESFSREFVGSLNKHLDNGQYEGYTPFIDSLLQYSTTFRYSYANGRKSIDALPSVVASVPFMKDPYILSPFSGNFLEGIGTLLKEKNYHTSFFHGAHRASMGFWSFMHLNGFDHSYAEEDYVTAHPAAKGGWGIWDEEFLQYMATELTKVSEPFCSVVFTLSSHHPYILPEKYDGVFKEGPSPLQRCIGYTDYALRRFFETASRQPWFENTLFVITADHANNPAFPENQNSVGQMSVPVIFFDPQNPEPRIYPYVAQQSDIMPTILESLHYDRAFIAFGQNALDTAKEHIAVNYVGNVHHVYYQQYVILYNEELELLGLYDLEKDPFMREHIEQEHPELVTRLYDYLRAYIQQYQNRMIDNRLIYRRDK